MTVAAVKEIRSESEGPADFEFTEADFKFLSTMIGERAGIVLSELKKDLVYGRLIKRLRFHQMCKFSDYCKLLKSGDGQELEEFVNALTTNLTSFYREAHHFEYLEQTIIPTLVSRKTDKTLRIWSAGCSTGAEPYSIAMSVSEAIPSDWDVKILATDIDTKVLDVGQKGIYDLEFAENGLDAQQLRRWTFKGTGPHAGKVKMKPELAEMISFRRLNLLERWPMQNMFDVVFCRNVVIYFDKDTQTRLFDRIAEQIAPESYLLIGHSESLNKVCDRFSLTGKNIYTKVR